MMIGNTLGMTTSKPKRIDRIGKTIDNRIHMVKRWAERPDWMKSYVETAQESVIYIT